MASMAAVYGVSMAACFAAGVLAGAASEGVGSLALAMTDGPLGVLAAQGVRPVYHVLRFAQGMGGRDARVEAGEVVRIVTAGGSMVAVLEGEAVLPAGARGWLLNEHSEIVALEHDWLARSADDLGGARLGRFDLAFLTGDLA